MPIKHTERVDAETIEITRWLDAKPSRVFAAWTRLEHLTRWFGPEGFRCETESFDLRAGGAWIFQMRHAEHGDFPNHIVFEELVPPSLVAYRHVEGSETLFRTRISMEPEDGGTRLAMRLTFRSAEACAEKIEQFGAVEGGVQTLARMDRLVEEAGPTTLRIQTEGASTLVISRVFVGSAERLFAAFTDGEQVARWMQTPGNPMTRCEIDVRPGGTSRYEWSGPRQTIGLTSTFEVVDAPHRIEHTEAFDDNWTEGPAHVTTTFNERGGTTEVRMVIRYSSAAVRDRVLDSPMKLGMDENFDALERMLAG